jgi:hypothetical protein
VGGGKVKLFDQIANLGDVRRLFLGQRRLPDFGEPFVVKLAVN